MYLQVTRGTIQRTYYPSAHRASYLGIRDTSNITHTPKNPPRPEVFRMCVWGLIRTTAAFYFATNKGRWGPLFKPGPPRHPHESKHFTCLVVTIDVCWDQIMNYYINNNIMSPD